MRPPLRVLLIASRDDLIERIDRALRDSSFDPRTTIVRDLGEVPGALAAGEFDIAICEHAPPAIDQAEALRRLRSSPVALPLLVASEHVDAMEALDAVRAGASDWLIDHGLARRLGPAVERALRERREHLEHAETVRQLEDSERHCRELADALPQIVYETDAEGYLTFVNQRGLAALGIDEAERGVRVHLSEILGAEDLDRAMQRLRRVMAGETTLGGMEFAAHLPDGRVLPVMVFPAPLVRQGEVVGERGVAVDLTDIKRAQEQLAVSERRYRTLVDAIGDGLVTVDREGVITFANQALADMVRLRIDSLEGHSVWDVLDRENAAIVIEGLHDRAAGEPPASYEISFNLWSGEPVTLLITATALCDEQGEVVGSLGVVKNVTEQRAREEQLRLTNARLRLMNQLSQRLNAGDSIEEVMAAGVDGLREILDLDEAFILLRDEAEPEMLVLQHASTAADHVPPIDEQVLAQVRGMRLHLDATSPAAEVYTAAVDLELCGLEACAQVLSHMTVPEHPSLPRSLAEGVHVNDTGYIFISPLRRGDRVIGHLSLSRRGERPLTEDAKAAVHTFAEQLAMAIDKASTEQELVRANQFLRGVIDNVAIWFAVVDETRQLVVWNRAAEEISGYRVDEIGDVDGLMEHLYPDPALRADVYDHVVRAQAGDQRAGTFETAIRRKDGSTRTILWHVRRISEPTPQSAGGLLVVGSDVTERRELQEQLRRSQRMEAVGTLAGGIAHDFNNVLTAILGHADLLAGDPEEDARVRWHALQIIDAAARASSLTRQLLAFSRRQPVRPQVVDLNRIVRGMAEIFRRLIRADIELRFDLDADLGYTCADPVQIEQVIMNLVVNARDAMPEGGRLTISTHSAELSGADMTELFDAEPGDYVVLSVADTGVGMDEATEAHIFEPFFSTKADRGGTGLGLATVYGIVRQSDGAITVYSEPGEGSVFRVYLPRTDRAGALDGSSGAQNDRAALRGSETVLIVEDTENLRTLVHTMLESLGYTAFSAGSGAEALELAAAHSGEIDLVVTDVIMPEMSGTDLAERLIEANPDMRVLYVSGYPTEKAVDAERQDARFSFLQKPFSATELGRKLGEIFDGKPLAG